MRNKLLYLIVPLFTFLAFYRFWNDGPLNNVKPVTAVNHFSAYAYPAAITSDDKFTVENNSICTQRSANTDRNSR